MDFFSLEFLAFAFTVVLISVPLRRNQRAYVIFLVLASLVFSATWGWSSLVCAVAVGLMPLLFRFNRRISRAVGWIAATLLIGATWFSRTYMSYFFHGSAARILVLGAPYTALQLLALSKEEPGEGRKRGFWREWLYLSYFPEDVVGPIERQPDFDAKVSKLLPLNGELAWRACFLVAFGFFKKAVVSSRLALAIQTLEAGHRAIGAGEAWILSAGLFFLEYLDFSAYINVATGFSLLLGIEPTPTFKQPYLATSPSDYWQRWNISFARCARDFFFFPVLARTRRVWLALVASFTFVFFWLGPNRWAFRFALSYGVFIFLENLWRASRFGAREVPRWLAVLLQFHLSCAIVLLIEGAFVTLPILPRFTLGTLATAIPAADYLVIGMGIAAVVCLETFGFDARERIRGRVFLALCLAFVTGALFRLNTYLFYYI
jgi:D-alanyl-lipoteichoic acid acyltransferase DltB (MBOAT superfamily)